MLLTRTMDFIGLALVALAGLIVGVVCFCSGFNRSELSVVFIVYLVSFNVKI